MCNRVPRSSRACLGVFFVLVAACHGAAQSGEPGAVTAATASPAAVISPAVQAAVDAPDRSDDDKKLDARRHPAQVLAFFGIDAGMRVAEIFAGAGYTTELLARTVGRGGVVYAENPGMLPPFAVKAWGDRLAKPVLGNVVRVDRDLDDPLPADARNLDAVVIILNYHDTAAAGVDRDRMNAAVFAALKHGGVYGIVDHSAKQGSGLADAKTLHRIDESTLRQEVERAGFRLRAEADFLRNPSDARDWNDSGRAAGERRGTSDRFVLRFEKP
jgi:predicted methyltransferase